MSEDPVMVCEHALADQKGQDVVHLNLTGRGAYADHLLIATATSDRHAMALSDRVVEYLRKSGFMVNNVEGGAGAVWIIVDAGDVVVHVFTQEGRDLYNIEKLYSHDFEEK